MKVVLVFPLVLLASFLVAIVDATGSASLRALKMGKGMGMMGYAKGNRGKGEGKEEEEEKGMGMMMGYAKGNRGKGEGKEEEEEKEEGMEEGKCDGDDVDCDNSDSTCPAECMSSFPFLAVDNSQRLLLREGVIDEIPPDLCGNAKNASKNVILVVGDGMGWEMVRAGAIARQIIDELESIGCDTKTGCLDSEVGDQAMALFHDRVLSDYYTEGVGSGLSWQDLPGYALVTTSSTVAERPTDGNHYAPEESLLQGNVTDHRRGQAPLRLDTCGCPVDFDPTDFELEGGNMVLWNNEIGGEFPWDSRYYMESPPGSLDNPAEPGGFDINYIMNHATDSANTAATLATGHKSANGMLSLTLYEERVNTLVEEAMYCGKAGGVVTSVPMLHATPAAFITHVNHRKDAKGLEKGFLEVLPTAVVGTCADIYYPSEETIATMRDGSLSSMYTVFEQKQGQMAENFYDGLEALDPDKGDKIFACMGGDFARVKGTKGTDNMPYRGVDSTYTARYCSNATVIQEDVDDSGEPIPVGINVTTSDELCDHYGPEDRAEIPKMAENVKATLEFLAKDDDGFFMMYEQGDIDWAAHANHMDDLLGTMLDIDDGVKEIMMWIESNGGYEKNALYVTADHDHFLTLAADFPRKLATFLIQGNSHMITPKSNSDKNPWETAIQAGRHEDDSKSQIEHLIDFTTWTEQETEDVGHFWGPVGSGGNGWGSHSTRPVPISYNGDDGCIDALLGTDFQVVGKTVAGVKGKIDQVHLRACMLKNLFGL